MNTNLTQLETKEDRRQTNYHHPSYPRVPCSQLFNVELTDNKNNEHELYNANKINVVLRKDAAILRTN